MTSIFNDFIYGLKKIECETPFLILIREHPPKYLENYVKTLQEVSFDDAKCNAYYGEIKKIIYSFLNFYTVCISHVSDEIDRYTQELKYSEMMDLFDKTLIYCDERQKYFKSAYKPGSVSEELQYNIIVSGYYSFRQKLVDLGAQLVDLKKPNQIEEFTKSHLPLCIKKTSQMCDYAHVFLSKMLFARVATIRISLLDIVHRIRRNTKEFNESYETKLNALYNEMYDLNKQRLSITRRIHTSSTDTAEIERTINMVRDKIEKFGNYETLNRLKIENEYWTKKLKEFDYITSIIWKVKEPLDKMAHEQEIYEKYRTIEKEGSKATCWATIGENFKLMRKDLEEKYTRACRSLITFFACKGTDRILYADDIGSYFVDEYGHQNYITNYGAKFYHVNCDGEFLENIENDKYYFDENGRYIIEDGERIFQLAPCTNRYKRTDEGLLYKYVACQCKFHCSRHDLSCGYDIKDLTEVLMLPKTEYIDIQNTLSSETVRYLWDSFGWILPEVLCQVGTANSRNPIHYFAHVLLNKKYAMTEKQTLEIKKAAEKFAGETQKQHDQSAEKSLAWKAKQAKPCKPEDLDTTQDHLAYLAHQAGQQYISDIVNYYYN